MYKRLKVMHLAMRLSVRSKGYVTFNYWWINVRFARGLLGDKNWNK